MRAIVSRIAMCHDCDWREEENSKRTLIAAKRHAARQHHLVVVEIVAAIHYDERVVDIGGSSADGRGSRTARAAAMKNRVIYYC